MENACNQKLLCHLLRLDGPHHPKGHLSQAHIAPSAYEARACPTAHTARSLPCQSAPQAEKTRGRGRTLRHALPWMHGQDAAGWVFTGRGRE
eukprot:360468-Chlamydomonas_euryale.AAC.3